MKNVTNSLNRIVPAEIAGVGSFAPYRSPFSTIAALGAAGDTRGGPLPR